MLPGFHVSISVAFKLQRNDRRARRFIVAEKLNFIACAVTLPGAGEFVGIRGILHFEMAVGTKFQFGQAYFHVARTFGEIAGCFAVVVVDRHAVHIFPNADEIFIEIL